MPYTLPPRAVLDAFDAPPTPLPQLSPDGARLALIDYDPHPSIEQLSRPYLKLAGVRIDPALGARQRTLRLTGITVVSTSDGSTTSVALPAGVSIGRPLWSPDSAWLAFTLDVNDGVELWVADAATGRARSLRGVRVNDVLAPAMALGMPGVAPAPFAWARGSDRLLVRLASNNGVQPPATSIAPRIEETAGKQSQMATFQDLLRNPADEGQFEHFATSQLAFVDASSGDVEHVGAPEMVLAADLSPDGRHLLTTTLQRPFSYRVPYAYFTRTTRVTDVAGRTETTIAELPVSDEIPRQGVPTGPRSVNWDEHKPATVLWLEALDGGDPTRRAEHRDRLMALDAPFGGRAREVLRMAHRFAGLAETSDGRVLLTERDRDRRWRTSYLLDLKAPDERITLFDLSIHDSYNDPGTPLTTTRSDGARLVEITGGVMHLAGRGASPEGDRPFLDAFDVRTGTAHRRWQCGAGEYAAPLGFASGPGEIVVRAETPRDPTNWFVVEIEGGDRRALTAYTDPHPSLTDATKRLVKYTRRDGVDLSGTLHLPPGYVPGRQVPVLIWAYPYDYADPDTAGQVRGSDATFTRITAASPLWLLTQGFAVLMDATMPVVGDPETMNDTFVDQIRMNAEAAIDALDDLGVADRDRVVVGGHSYGGFMTANLLAHTDLFAAGLARSGAHNRTLTPFGFQTERRSFWEAPEVYLRMSPFRYADQIKAPILLMHGEDDNNSGTFPIQSERLYQAIQGLGGTARLVMLPHEAHGYRARESVLHAIAEMIEWSVRWTSAEVRPVPAREPQAASAGD